jgi:hypothetical protein
MKGHATLAQPSSMDEAETIAQTITTREELESYFNKLSEITDRVALINSEYQTDIATAVNDLENFMSEESFRSIDRADQGLAQSFLSHMSFHREIIADIINGARQLLIEERREFLRRLVAYHKSFVKNFSIMEKRLHF